MLTVDLKGRRALVAGVADDGGFGFAIAKSLAGWGELFVSRLRLRDGISNAHPPWQARCRASCERRAVMFDFSAVSARRRLRDDGRRPRGYPWSKALVAERGDFTIDGIAKALVSDFGEKPSTSSSTPSPTAPTSGSRSSRRAGAAIQSRMRSAALLVERSRCLGPLMRAGGLVPAHVHGERAGHSGYGGGMSFT